MSTRQDLMTYLKSGFEDITIANGYSFDINKIFEWRDTPLNDGEFDSIIIFDTSEYFSEDTEDDHILDIQIVVVPDPGSDAITNLRSMIEDVLIFFKDNEDYIKANINVEVKFTGSEISIEHTKKKYFEGLMTFEISYHTDRWEI